MFSKSKAHIPNGKITDKNKKKRQETVRRKREMRQKEQKTGRGNNIEWGEKDRGEK